MNGQDTADSELLMSLDGRKQPPVRAATVIKPRETPPTKPSALTQLQLVFSNTHRIAQQHSSLQLRGQRASSAIAPRQ